MQPVLVGEDQLLDLGTFGRKARTMSVVVLVALVVPFYLRRPPDRGSRSVAARFATSALARSDVWPTEALTKRRRAKWWGASSGGAQ